MKGYFEIVELLLSYGANIDHVDNDGENAFSLAYQGENYLIIELLHQYKIKSF